MVAGGPRQRGCGAGHAFGRRAGRVSPCRLEIKAEHFFEKLVFGTLFECPGILDSRAHAQLRCQGGVKAALHWGPRELAALRGRPQKHVETTGYLMGKLIKKHVICATYRHTTGTI